MKLVGSSVVHLVELALHIALTGETLIPPKIDGASLHGSPISHIDIMKFNKRITRDNRFYLCWVSTSRIP